MAKEKLARELEALIAEIDEAKARPRSQGLGNADSRAQIWLRLNAKNILAALSPPNVAGEEVAVDPIALLHEHPKFGRELEFYRFGAHCLTDADKAAGWSETPLYAAPPTTEQPPFLREAYMYAQARVAPTTEVRVEGEVERLREALEPFANAVHRIDYYDGDDFDAPLYASRTGISLRELLNGIGGDLRRARAALAIPAAEGGSDE